MKRTLLLICAFLMTSCEKELQDLGENQGLLGTWVQQEQDGEVAILHRASEFDPELYGFTLHEDGLFTEHKNAGWCGTPPISYAEFEGSWEALSDSLLDITVGYWGGTMTYQIRIVSVDDSELRIRYLFGDARAESR